MKPNCFAARLEREGDYEAFICNGESLYHYNGLAHAVTEYKLPVPGKDLSDGEEIPLPAGLDPNDKYVKKARKTFAAAQFSSRDESLRISEILSGTNPKALAKRFDISLDKEDANYLYLSIKPISEYDKLSAREFKVSLLGPKHAFAYSPIQLLIERLNGDKEVWTLSGHKMNSPDIAKASFSYKSLPGFEFRSASGKDPQMPPTKK
jgi:TIGR03009 family protein